MKYGMFILALFIFSPLNSESQALAKTIQNFSDTAESEYRLSYITSLQWGHDKVRSISLYYSSNQPKPIGPTEELIEEVTEQFLSQVNTNPQLKNDLYTYPISAKELEIEIFFRGKNGKYASPPNVARVTMSKGVITLYQYSQNTFKVIHEGHLD